MGVVCIGNGWSSSSEESAPEGAEEGGGGCVALVAAHSGGPVLQLWTPHHTYEHALRRHLVDTPAHQHHYHGKVARSWNTYFFCTYGNIKTRNINI